MMMMDSFFIQKIAFPGCMHRKHDEWNDKGGLIDLQHAIKFRLGINKYVFFVFDSCMLSC